MNQSENASNPLMNISVNYILAFLFLIIAIVGIMGNILVILSVQLDVRMRRSLTNRLIIHVACCDLLILLFNIPDIIQFVSSIHGNWVLSEFACKFLRTILVLAQYASVLTMCAVTIERFIGIVYPLRSKFLREKKHVTRITLVVWIFSLLCASPNLFYLRVKSMSPTRRSCYLQYSKGSSLQNHRSYIIHKSIESTIFYFLPLFLQLFSYTRIALRLFRVDQTLQPSIMTMKKSNQKTQNEIDDEEDSLYNVESKVAKSDSFVQSPTKGDRAKSLLPKFSVTADSSSLSIFKNRQEERKDSYQRSSTSNALKSRRNVIKMLIVVVLIYFVSFSPQVIVFILFDTNAIRPVPAFIQTPYFNAFTMILVTISSASNPIVYAIFCPKFRLSFKKILQRFYSCGKTTIDHQTSKSLQQLPKEISHLDGNRQTNITIQLKHHSSTQRI